MSIRHSTCEIRLLLSVFVIVSLDQNLVRKPMLSASSFALCKMNPALSDVRGGVIATASSEPNVPSSRNTRTVLELLSCARVASPEVRNIAMTVARAANFVSAHFIFLSKKEVAAAETLHDQL